MVIRASSRRGVGLKSQSCKCSWWLGSCRLAFSSESLSCSCHLESSLGLVSQGRGDGGGEGRRAGRRAGGGSDHHKGSFAQHVSALSQAADFSYSLVPCWLFTFYPNGLRGDKFNSQFCQTCISSSDLLFPLCGAGTMPRSVPCLDSSFACAAADAQAFASLFALNL